MVPRTIGSPTQGPATPRALGYRMPAEWEPHERCLMAWPVREEAWRGTSLEAARHAYAEVARAISAFEPVTMIAPAEVARNLRDLCGAGVDVLELPLDDSWVRDSGPTFLLGPGGERMAADFAFNGWGEKFVPYADDAALGERICERLRVERRAAPMVLEGGSITVDGDGTLVTTEQCLLHPSRNPLLAREEIESALREFLGAEAVVWLGDGLVEDRDTDGHVDNLCAFVAPGRLLLQAVSRPDDPNAALIEDNRERLRSARDARGRELELVELPHLPRAGAAAVPYLNLYLANGAAIVPVTGRDPDRDAEALRLIAAACPGREAVPVPGETLALGGGGVHCITQQVPALRSPDG